MPAVTADTLTLPRLNPATLGDTERPVRSVTTGPRGFEGEGFPVVRAFAGVATARPRPVHPHGPDGRGGLRARVSPRAPPWHPHRGFETVTYMIDGTFLHQDSHGGGGVITNGATQWMTAGAGILHIETPPEELVGQRRAVPRLPAVGEPAREGQVHRTRATRASRAARSRCSARADGGALRAGHRRDVDGHAARARRTRRSRWRTPPSPPGAQLSLPWQPDYNALAYVLAGSGTVGAERRPIARGQLAVFGAGDRLTVAADGAQDPAGRARRCCCSAGGRSASRWRTTARS